MPRDFFKSKEGEAAYAELRVPYPEELYDAAYSKWTELTKRTKEKDIKRYIQSMKRYITREGEEFLVYGESVTKQDPLGNEKSFYRGNIGKYGRPVPHYEIKVNAEEGYAKEKFVSHIDRVDDCYSIPFTKENVEPLHKYTDGNTAFVIQKEDFQSGRRLSIASYEDWIDGDVIELLRFGHRASSYEKQILADEKIGKYLDHVTPQAGRVYL